MFTDVVVFQDSVEVDSLVGYRLSIFDTAPGELQLFLACASRFRPQVRLNQVSLPGRVNIHLQMRCKPFVLSKEENMSTLIVLSDQDV